MKNEIQENFAKKNKDSEIRHEKNVIQVKRENKKLAKATEEREFQKYITYYFLKKGQNQSLSKKKNEQNNKLQEKADKLEEIEKQIELKRTELLRKMNKMDKKREEYIKLKEERISEDKKRRNQKEKKMQNKINEMNKEELERRKDVLDYQTDLVIRSMNKTNKNMRKNNSGQNSISNQIALQSHMSLFNRKLNYLKSQSVSKKPFEERVKMYRNIKRKEAERIRREKEDELLYKGH